MSKSSERRFKREREAHYQREREVEALKKQARLKGFKVASVGDMTAVVLGTKPADEGAAVAHRLNRAQRRMRGIR